MADTCCGGSLGDGGDLDLNLDLGLSETSEIIENAKFDSDRFSDPTFLIGSIEDMNNRIGILTQRFQNYTQLVVERHPRRLSDERDPHVSCACSRLKYRQKGQSSFRMNTQSVKKDKDQIKPKLIMLDQFAGFDPQNLTPLPDYTAEEILQIVVNAAVHLDEQSPYEAEFRRLIFSPMSQAILQDMFWYVYLHTFQFEPNISFLRDLFNRTAHNYVKLIFFARNPPLRKIFMKDYPKLMFQSLYCAFCYCFVDSYAQFGETFKNDLLYLVFGWMAEMSFNLDYLDSLEPITNGNQPLASTQSAPRRQQGISRCVSKSPSASRQRSSSIHEGQFQKSHQTLRAKNICLNSPVLPPVRDSQLYVSRKKSKTIDIHRKRISWSSDEKQSSSEIHICKPSSQTSVGSAKTCMPQTCKDNAKEYIPQISEDSAKKSIPHASEDNTKTFVPHTSEDNAKESVPQTSEDKAKESVPHTLEDDAKACLPTQDVDEDCFSSWKKRPGFADKRISWVPNLIQLSEQSCDEAEAGSSPAQVQKASAQVHQTSKCMSFPKDDTTEGDEADSAAGTQLSSEQRKSKNSQNIVESLEERQGSRQEYSPGKDTTKEKKTRKMKSHPACRGPEFLKAAFNIYGHSPLVAHFLRTSNFTTDLNQLSRVQRTEIDSLPPLDAPSYQDVIKQSTRTVKAIEESFKELLAKCQKEWSTSFHDRNEMLREHSKREACLLANRLEMKRLSNLIILEQRKGIHSVSAGAREEVEAALKAQELP